MENTTIHLYRPDLNLETTACGLLGIGGITQTVLPERVTCPACIVELERERQAKV